MTLHAPRARLETHDVTNQPPDFPSHNLFLFDRALHDAAVREGGAWLEPKLSALGREAGSEEVMALGEAANRHVPELLSFDRAGRRLDEVRFHPAWHALMALAMRHGIHSIAWTAGRPGGHVAHAAMLAVATQAEAGCMCPISMTYASVPVLRQAPALMAEWGEKILHGGYDPRLCPIAAKTGITVGMAMTEKQGGSDLRGTTTHARALGGGGPGGEYALTGHKWFCSAPMSDGFLTLARTNGALSCFLVPRITPDGERNAIHLMRLKDKLGNRSNASAEIEYHGATGWMVGEDGRGVATIIDMVHHTRLDTMASTLGIMRMALAQAMHHARHRQAFGRRLVDQAAMRGVLADLALEYEAAAVLVMRVARAFDAPGVAERAFARLAVAAGKFWLCKRAPGFVAECMECLGGNGYVEESILPRLYREAPVNGIWEGSANVIALDVLRTLGREPAALEVWHAEVAAARRQNAALDAEVAAFDTLLASGPGEGEARLLCEVLALLLQGALLLRHVPGPVADLFCATRLDGRSGRARGTVPVGVGLDGVLDRVLPA